MKHLACSILGAVLLSPVGAMAQYAMVPGNFSSSDTKLQVIGLDTENGDVAAAASVVQGACSGTIAGLGKVVNQKLTFTPREGRGWRSMQYHGRF